MPTSESTLTTHTGFPWRTAIALYGTSYGLCLFFLRAFFWDDWAVKTLSEQMERAYWKDVGFPPTVSFILIDVFQRNPIYIHLATLLMFFACGWFLFEILQKVYFITADERKLITIIFLVLPINSARVAMQMFSYSYSIFFFYAAWYFLVVKRGWATKLIAVVFFLLSFNTLSLITFIAVPVFHLLLLNTNKFANFKFRAFAGPILLILMAPVYWIFIKTAYPPSDLRISYYSPKFSGTIRGLLLLLISTSFLAWTIQESRTTQNLRSTKIALGAVIVSLGAFPYITSGRLVDVSEWMLNFVPRASEWESRNQLLLGLGIALLITSSIRESDSKFKTKAAVTLIGLCVFMNFTFMQGYMLDARKQSEVIQMLSASETVKSGNVIMINDLAVRYNARGRLVRTYEWNGMLEKAFGDKSRSSAYFAYVDCINSEVPIPDVLVTIDASNGRFKSLLTSNIGINMTAIKISPCPAK